MPIRYSIWRVGQSPRALNEGQLASEAPLEDMIVAAPAILSAEWMLMGRQEQTGHSSRIDLLALAPDEALTLIALKRARTPREVEETRQWHSKVSLVIGDDPILPDNGENHTCRSCRWPSSKH